MIGGLFVSQHAGLVVHRRQLNVGGQALALAGELEVLHPSTVNFADLIAASIDSKYSVGPSIRPIYTGCCFTMTNKIQAWSNFR